MKKSEEKALMLTLPTGETATSSIPPLSELLDVSLTDTHAWVRSSLFLNTLASLRSPEECEPL